MSKASSFHSYEEPAIAKCPPNQPVPCGGWATNSNQPPGQAASSASPRKLRAWYGRKPLSSRHPSPLSPGLILALHPGAHPPLGGLQLPPVPLRLDSGPTPSFRSVSTSCSMAPLCLTGTSNADHRAPTLEPRTKWSPISLGSSAGGGLPAPASTAPLTSWNQPHDVALEWEPQL